MKRMGEPADRAVQFSAYEALQGYDSYLEEACRFPEERRELAQEEGEDLGACLAALRPGQTVRVTYYRRQAYVTETVTVSEVDPVFRLLRCGRRAIPFDDLLRLEALPNEV